MGGALTSEELLNVLTAIGHAQRLRIIAELTRGRVHVSELARRLELSRPLLYLHLGRLESAGLVSGQLELSPDGKAMKYYALEPFDLHLSAATVLDAIEADRTDATGPDPAAGSTDPPGQSEQDAPT